MSSNTTTITAGRRALRHSACTLTCTLMGLPGAGLAQQGADLGDLVFEPVPLSAARESPLDLGGRSESETQVLLDTIESYLADIEPLQQEGSSSPELIGRLAQLGLVYQALNRHEEAIDTFDAAIALTVENGGANNLAQIPLQEQKIQSYLALDDIGSVDDTEELVYALKESSYDPASREMYYATINLADWNTAAYFLQNYRQSLGRAFRRVRTVARRAPRSIRDLSGGTNPIFNGAITGIDEQDIVDLRLRKIDRLYTAYQNAAARAGNVQVDIAIDIAKRIARLAHLTKQEMDFERDNYSFDPDYDGSPEQALRMSAERMEESYEAGRLALERILDILREAEGMPVEALAAARLDLADWHLSYGKVGAAEDTYGEAYRTLLDAGFSSSNIDRALRTGMPPRIPIFATQLYSKASAGLRQDTVLRFRGYVDLAYSVDNIGNPSDLEFLGGSPEDTSLIEALIASQFKSIKFRPVLSGGELVAPGRVEARYYYSY